MACSRRWRALAGFVAVAAVAAACGDDDAEENAPVETAAASAPADSTAGSAPAEPAGDVDPNGVLRFGFDMSVQGGFCLDPTEMSLTGFTTLPTLYDRLIREMSDGSYEPGLAESVRIVDPQTIEIVLREGLEFSDGTPLDAEAVKFNIERNVASQNGNAFQPVDNANISEVEVVNATTAVLHLAQPSASLVYPLLAKNESAMLSPTAVSSGADMCTAPVAAGPFMVESFEPDSKVTFVKNPSYFDADNVRLAGVEYVNVAAAGANAALNSGAVDILLSNFTSSGELRPPITLDSEPAVGDYILNFCMTRPPFDNLQVRQALNFATDRDALNQSIYGGDSAPAWSMWPPSHPWHDGSLTDVYKYDVDKAKQLLSEAGYPDGVEFNSFVPVAGDGIRMIEILQQQWAEAGITMNLVQSTNLGQDFFVDVKEPANIYPNRRGGLDKISVSYAAEGFGNVCDYNPPELDQLMTQFASSTDEHEQAQLVQQMQEHLISDQAMYVELVYEIEVWAYNEDIVGDVTYYRDPIAYRFPQFQDMYRKN